MTKFAVGAIIVLGNNDSGGEAEKVEIELIEATSIEEALGKFFFPYLGKAVKVRDFSIKSENKTDNFDPEVVDFCRKGMKINAIKRYRELSGEGLREAKDYIEQVVIPQLKQKGLMPNES